MKTKTLFYEPIGNPDRKYRQDHFMISSCIALAVEGYQKGGGDLRECIRNVKEAGCNLAEFIWADPEETEKCIEACEEFELDGVFQNWDAFGGFQGSRSNFEINYEKLDLFMEFSKKFRHFYGYYVWDEPLSERAVDTAAAELREIERLDPARLPFIVAIPSYNLTDTWENGKYEAYLTRFAKVIDPPVMSLDYYPFSAMRPDPSNQLDDKLLFLDIALLRKLALGINAPMWFYIQAMDSPINSNYYRFTPQKLSMQAFNVLLHGGKAVQYYCTVEGAVYWDGRPGPLFFPMKELNRRIQRWGKTLMALKSEGVYHSPEVLAGCAAFDPYREPVSESKVLLDQDLPFRCSVGELSDREGNRYLLILNRDYKNAREFRIGFRKAFRVYKISDETGGQTVLRNRAENLRLRLNPGDAVFLRVQDAEEEPYLIRYELTYESSNHKEKNIGHSD